MKRILLFLLLTFTITLHAQVVYEDFEGTPLEWNPFGDGVYNGAVDNPDPNFINSSAKVGSYTKSDLHSYSLLIAFVDPAMDLSVNNQFSIDVYTPSATQILFKLEGDGEAIESVRNIANADVWQTHTFDLSAAADFTTITKIIIFFDPGVEESGDTYLFDNIVANPAGPCAGTVPDLAILDDFECQRNGTYSVGWDVIMQVPNPDPSPVNMSLGVGQYEDPPGSYTPLIFDYNNSIDLSELSVFKAKIWAPVTGNMLIKLEGGVSPAYEDNFEITETNTWLDFEIDFTSQASADHKALVIFFNAGVEPGPGEIYYIDEISMNAPPPPKALEDFEDGPSLGWEPLNGDAANHGTFDGVMANPDNSGINDSPNVGRYTKGDAAFSTLTSFLPEGLDLSENTQLNMQVRAPEGSQSVTMQLVSATEGGKSINRAIETTMEWTLLEFNFEEFEAITDFESINLIFDEGIAAPGTSFMFDNITQSTSTVDPCETVVANHNIWDDFECQRNIVNLYNGMIGDVDRVAIIPNPDVSTGNVSASVGEYTDLIGEAWNGIGYDLGGPIDLSIYNQLNVKIWSPKVVPILFKLEGGSSAAVEVFMDISDVNTWVNYTIDFSENVDESHNKLFMFFDAANNPDAEVVYLIDDITWNRGPYTECIATYDDPALIVEGWGSFENGSLGGIDNFVVDNPVIGGINESEKVIQFTEANDASQPWAGFFKDLDSHIIFGENRSIRVKVLMPSLSSVTFKLEGSQVGQPQTGDITVENTKVGEWEELVFDYNFTEAGSEYKRLVFIFNINEIPTENLLYYVDDIVIEGGSCVTTSVFNTPRVDPFIIYPNPAQNILIVENMENVQHIEIFNLVGSSIGNLNVNRGEDLNIDISQYENGLYFIAGYDKNKNLIANSKFVKI